LLKLNKMLNRVIIIFLIVAFTSAQQIAPVPQKPSYYQLNAIPTNIILDVYVNHLCPDTARAWPGVYSYW
jgi:hypothetical protein